MSSVSLGSSAAGTLSFSGLASGLNTTAIISALMSAERAPATRMTQQAEKLGAQQQQLQSVQSSLRQVAFAASELSLPSLFETSQTVSSSEPARVAAVTTAGAGIGGHEVEVKRLANSGQRTFTFTSPKAEDTITVDGREYKLAAGATAKTLAEAINADSKATVYAAALESGEVVLSTRATGATGPEFIKVTDPGGTLKEVEKSAREGVDAEYAVDGVEAKATTNTVTSAIPGVTLTLLGVTTTAGPVTIDVQPPGPSVSAVETQVKSFITSYNSAVEALQHQLTTKPVSNPSASQLGTGSLFGDQELGSLLATMRESMYTPIEGLAAGMASPADAGIGTGAATGKSGSSQSAIEGLIKLEPEKLAAAVHSEPAAVQKMLAQWSQGLQKAVETVAGAGGTMEARITGETAQVAELHKRVAAMDEVLLSREKTLQQTYAALEGVISQNSTQASWLSSQAEGLTRAGL